MKVFYQKEMCCPLCGKKILNQGRTNDSGLFEEEKFRCWRCKQEFTPYETNIKKMFMAHKYAIDTEKNAEGWKYRVLDILHGKVLKNGVEPDAACAMALCKQVLRECHMKYDEIQSLSDESRLNMIEIFERSSKIVPAKAKA